MAEGESLWSTVNMWNDLLCALVFEQMYLYFYILMVSGIESID